MGLDQLLVFRIPASPLDIAGWISLVLARGNPVAYVEGECLVHCPPPASRHVAAEPRAADASFALTA
jgi:hypothetical protein